MTKYDRCEKCGKARLDGELLFTVDCWVAAQYDGRRMWSYHHVCDLCYETRHLWCEDVFPDICARCGSAIPHAEHCFDNTKNRDGKNINVFGLAADEVRSIICEACYHQATGD